MDQPLQPEGPAEGVAMGRLARCRKLLAHVPRWAIAVLLVSAWQWLILMHSTWFFPNQDFVGKLLPLLMAASVFTAGAIRRLNWRHALILLAATAVYEGVDYAIDQTGVAPSTEFHPYRWMLRVSILLWLLGMGEAFTTGHRSPVVIVWVLIAAVSIEAARQVAMSMVEWTDWQVKVSVGAGSWERRRVAGIIYWPVLALAGWSGLALALAALKRGRRAFVAAGAVFAAAAALHTLFFNHSAFVLAKSSLAGDGPFSRNMGVLLLKERGRPADFDLIVAQLCQADLTESLVDIDDPRRPDWRSTAIEVLARHKGAGKRAAETLASMLREKRSLHLAALAANLLAEERRVETVPILLRYALSRNATLESEMCCKALERMGIPEAGHIILEEALLHDRPRFHTHYFEVSADHRRRLALLLGKDVGPLYSAWQKAFTEATDERTSSPLPDVVQDEVDREMACYFRYMEALTFWYDARRELIRRRLADAGKQELVDAVVPSKKEVGGRYVWEWQIPESAKSQSNVLQSAYEAATEDMVVPDPDCDAPTIEGYEKEVAAYRDRVRAVMRKYAPPPSSPRSSAASTSQTETEDP